VYFVVSYNYCLNDCSVRGIDCGEEAAVWCQTVLDRPGLRLIKQVEDDARIIKCSSPPKVISGSCIYYVRYISNFVVPVLI